MKRRTSRRPQLAFEFRQHGGARRNAGRKASARRKGFEPHLARADLDANHPVHVAIRAKPGCPRLRQERLFRAIRARIAAANANATQDGFQIIHFSVQENHLHFVVEATDRATLARGMQRLGQRITWDVNRLTGRHGSLWRDRYTRRDLTSLRQVRNALVYVLMNVRKHSTNDEEDYRVARRTLDPRSSAAWFDGWHPRAGPMLAELQRDLAASSLTASPVAPPRTWLARTGWKRHGLILPTEAPSSV
jgi:putative transposase